jgi:hypothetical protein
VSSLIYSCCGRQVSRDRDVFLDHRKQFNFPRVRRKGLRWTPCLSTRTPPPACLPPQFCIWCQWDITQGLDFDLGTAVPLSTWTACWKEIMWDLLVRLLVNAILCG